jgi:hypothetical protein
MDPLMFADFIYNECTQERYPNITIAVDSDGIGAATADQLVRRGASPVRIRWGSPMFSKEDKKRYANQRTFANFSARDAIMSGRMRLDSSEKTATQASRIPYELKEDGTLKMTEKKVMRQKLNIPSPDRWDTYCFAWLVDYTLQMKRLRLKCWPCAIKCWRMSKCRNWIFKSPAEAGLVD